ncbi:MAG: Sec-independent protein translocase protein TatB [Candidatus Pelagibacter bacterium]|jgi:sec-independent protein translocase protein TatB|nr:Sec-independent protein translocase protein TatB [Candidatus Pelagibacter bacterium]|tara:strand:- start:24 stop:269 length:246 start_codon:yes stop_codon:yes gene_type:complete
MPQIGWFEILIIVAVAIIVIGPKDFPIMLKKIGSWIGTIKRYVNKVQQEVSVLDNENFDQNIDEVNKNQAAKKNTNDQGTK